jgi:hypothetical protein
MQRKIEQPKDQIKDRNTLRHRRDKVKVTDLRGQDHAVDVDLTLKAEGLSSFRGHRGRGNGVAGPTRQPKTKWQRSPRGRPNLSG